MSAMVFLSKGSGVHEVRCPGGGKCPVTRSEKCFGTAPDGRQCTVNLVYLVAAERGQRKFACCGACVTAVNRTSTGARAADPPATACVPLRAISRHWRSQEFAIESVSACEMAWRCKLRYVQDLKCVRQFRV